MESPSPIPCSTGFVVKKGSQMRASAASRGRRRVAVSGRPYAFSHCSNASNACGRPRKSFTSSAAGFEPPASRIALR